MKKLNTVALAYCGIITVAIIWGVIPLVKKALIGNSFSASIFSAITTLSSALVLMLISKKQLKQLDKSYFKIAVPTGASVGAAVICQALAYNFNASPSNQAFLENLSCLIVPALLFFIVKKRPSLLTVAGCVGCLFSSMILAGVLDNGLVFSTADVLNATAGLLYGVNIAITGIYAKKYVASLYVMIQLFVQSAFSFAMAIVFNFVSIGGTPIDPFVFSADVLLILLIVAVGIISNALCWTVRTAAMKQVSAAVVAVIMPFSAAVTGLCAVLVGQDTLTPSLIIGALIGVAAAIASSIADIKK